jgi:hypothetical protein
MVPKKMVNSDQFKSSRKGMISVGSTELRGYGRMYRKAVPEPFPGVTGMFAKSSVRANEFPKPGRTSAQVSRGSEPAEQAPPEPPYKPYPKQVPVPGELPYKPYSRKPDEKDERPYEPYKGI